MSHLGIALVINDLDQTGLVDTGWQLTVEGSRNFG